MGRIKEITLSNYALIAKHKHQTNETLKLINNSPKPVRNWSDSNPCCHSIRYHFHCHEWPCRPAAERFLPRKRITKFRISLKRKLNVLSIKSKYDGGKMNTNGPNFSLKCFYRTSTILKKIQANLVSLESYHNDLSGGAKIIPVPCSGAT